MIGRIWRAVATPEGAKRYTEHFHGAVVPSLRRLDGFHRAYLLQRDADDHVEIETLTVWASMAAVESFAGPDPDHAVVEPAAQAAVLSYDSRVRHVQLEEFPA
jgi:heme-degrading monooxygenase HmoA